MCPTGTSAAATDTAGAVLRGTSTGATGTSGSSPPSACPRPAPRTPRVRTPLHPPRSTGPAGGDEFTQPSERPQPGREIRVYITSGGERVHVGSLSKEQGEYVFE
jgi:hypothetical protein